MRPCRRQPTRLSRPWDSPGNNIGVGCHFLPQCMKVKSESEVAQSCPTLATPWTAAYQAPPPWDFPGKSTGVGCHLDVYTLPIPHLPRLSHPSPPTCTPPFRDPLPWRPHLPLTSVPEVLTPKNSLRLQDSPRMQTSGPSFSLQLLQALQAKDKTLWKNSLSQKAAHVHQSQYTVYSKTICHSRGLVINFPSCKYIPLGVRTASSCYPRKL